jgi:hypothetical protein
VRSSSESETHPSLNFRLAPSFKSELFSSACGTLPGAGLRWAPTADQNGRLLTGLVNRSARDVLTPARLNCQSNISTYRPDVSNFPTRVALLLALAQGLPEPGSPLRDSRSVASPTSRSRAHLRGNVGCQVEASSSRTHFIDRLRMSCVAPTSLTRKGGSARPQFKEPSSDATGTAQRFASHGGQAVADLGSNSNVRTLSYCCA